MKPKETKGERVIGLIAGPSGSGKSFFIANLRNALIFDTDIGGGLSYADARIRANGSERIEVASYLDILDELAKRKKAGTLDAITTLAIDHLSSLHQESNIRHNPTFASDYGRANEKATREWRRLRELVRFGDFNLVCTAHQKDRYENDKAVGKITDGSKNVEADFSIVLYLVKGNKPPATATVQKWRRDPDDPRGLPPESFTFTMDEFLKIHGAGMDGKRHEIPMATQTQVAELTRLVGVLTLPEDTVAKWLSKAKCDDFSGMTMETIQKCIDYCNALVKGAA